MPCYFVHKHTQKKTYNIAFIIILSISYYGILFFDRIWNVFQFLQNKEAEAFEFERQTIILYRKVVQALTGIEPVIFRLLAECFTTKLQGDPCGYDHFKTFLSRT